jgi:hypothetical protein
LTLLFEDSTLQLGLDSVIANLVYYLMLEQRLCIALSFAIFNTCSTSFALQD